MAKKEKIGSEQQRKQYTRYRDIIRKRLQRLKNAGFENEPIYYQSTRLLTKLVDVKRENELLMRLRDMQEFIADKPTTLKAYRAERERQANVLGKLLFGRQINQQEQQQVLQYSADMAAEDSERVEYLLTTPYLTRQRIDELTEEIRGRFLEWQRLRE